MCDYKYSVLDLGCASGGDYEKWLLLKATDILGIDFIAAKKGTRRDLLSDDMWKSVKEQDVISCCFVLEYLVANSDGLRLFLNGLCLTLSPKGRAIFIIADGCWKNTKRKKFGCHILQQIDEETFRLSDSPPQYWIDRNTLLEETKKQDLEIVFESNLASYAAWLGVGCTKTSEFIQMKWKTSHEPKFKTICNAKITSSDWALCSFYKIIIIQKKNTTISKKSIMREFTAWKNAF